MFKLKSIFFITIFSVILLSCKTQQRVVTFTNEDSNFKNYKSFNIINYKKGEDKYSLEGELFVEKIKEGIIHEMNIKNYEQSKNPDIIVRYEVISTISVSSNNNTNNQYDRYGNNRFNQFNQNNTFNNPNTTSKFIEGVLLIELKDKKSKKLIWQASLDLKYARKKTKNENLISNAIQTLFEKYNYEAGNDKPIPVD